MPLLATDPSPSPSPTPNPNPNPNANANAYPDPNPNPNPNQARWPFPPHTLRVLSCDAAVVPPAEAATLAARARRPLSGSELGLLLGGVAAWQLALAEGWETLALTLIPTPTLPLPITLTLLRWEWCLVLADGATPRHAATAPQLLAALPPLARAAAQHDAQWALLVLSPCTTPLSPVDSAAVLAACPPEEAAPAPGGHGPGAPRGLLASPQPLGEAGGAGGAGGAPGWQRVGPTCDALGWVYSAALMRDLLGAWEAREPPLSPLGVWVWEVMAARGHLPHVLAPIEPLVAARP